MKYSAPGEEAKVEQLAPVGSLWEAAWGAFVMFFRLKTRREWEGRGVRGGVGGDAFVYTAPRGGEPRGVGLGKGGGEGGGVGAGVLMLRVADGIGDLNPNGLEER